MNGPINRRAILTGGTMAAFTTLKSNRALAGIGSCQPIMDHLTPLGDVTIPDDSQLSAGSLHTKTWHIRNDSDKPWEDCWLSLLFVSGGEQARDNWVTANPERQFTLPNLLTGEEADISIPIKLPEEKGTYIPIYMAMRGDGAFFEDVLYISVHVI